MSFLKKIDEKSKLLAKAETELLAAKSDVLKTFKIESNDYLSDNDVFIEEFDAKWFYSDGILFIFLKEQGTNISLIDSGIKDIDTTIQTEALNRHTILSDDHKYMIVKESLELSEWSSYKEFTILSTDNEILFEEEAIKLYDQYKINSNVYYQPFKTPTFESFGFPVITFEDWLRTSE